MKITLRSGLLLALALSLLAGCATQAPNGGPRAGMAAPKPVDVAKNAASLAGGYRAASVSGDYAGYAALDRFIERMVKEQGYPREYLNGLFSQARRKQWTIDYMNRQAPVQGAKPSPGGWSRYRDKFLDEQHIGKGAAFWARHAETLQKASDRYGVPPEYIMGIMGVETLFGGNMGNHRIIDALTTLAFDYPRRADYFTEELANFLAMARKEGIDPGQPVGSFAGAMGLGQFMPGSFLRWGVDFNGDGRCNLWDPEDAIGSIANYFAQHGWRPAEPVVTPAAAVEATADSLDYGFDTHYSLSALAKSGVRPLQSCPVEDVRLLRLSSTRGTEYWLGHQNFYVITRYNNSTHYAMAVHQLAQSIKERYRGVFMGQR